MTFGNAARAVRSLRYENIMVRYGMGLMACVMAVQGFYLVTRPQSVILVPPFQHEQLEFIEGRANRPYYEQWAWSLSMLMGNISPGNADFVKAEVQRMATPALYRKMAQTMEAELTALKADSAVITFTPAAVTYDPELELFFVSGTQTVSGPGQRTDASEQITYEMGFVTERLRIAMDHFAVYDGEPLTRTIRNDCLAERERARAEAEQAERSRP